MNDDDNRRAMARCEEQYLREPERDDEYVSDETVEAIALAAYEAGRADGLREGVSEVERLLERMRRECLQSVETLTRRRDAAHELAVVVRHRQVWRETVERVCTERRAHHRRGAK